MLRCLRERKYANSVLAKSSGGGFDVTTVKTTIVSNARKEIKQVSAKNVARAESNRIKKLYHMILKRTPTHVSQLLMQSILYKIKKILLFIINYYLTRSTLVDIKHPVTTTMWVVAYRIFAIWQFLMMDDKRRIISLRTFIRDICWLFWPSNAFHLTFGVRNVFSSPQSTSPIISGPVIETRWQNGGDLCRADRRLLRPRCTR